MTPNLLSLPNELLLDIAGNLANPALSALCRTNRRLFNLANSMLWSFFDDGPDGSGDLLNRAAKLGHVDTARKLLDKCDVDPDTRTFTGDVPLQTAVMFDQEAMMFLLLEHGADISCPVFLAGGTRRSTLEMAAICNRCKMASILIAHGPNTQDVRDSLRECIYQDEDSLGMLLFLLPALRDIDNRYHGTSLLYNQTRAGCGLRPSVVSALLWAGADPNLENYERRWALHGAARNGYGGDGDKTAPNIEVLGLLLDSGADIDAKDHFLMTPIDYALNLERTDVARFLLSRGASVAHRRSIDNANPFANSPLLLDAISYPEIVDVLVRDENITGNNAESSMPATFRKALYALPKPSAEEEVKIIAMHRTDTEAFFHGCRFGLLPFVEWMVLKGFDINTRDEVGRTGLHIAVCGGMEDMSTYLLDNTDLVNDEDYRGCTPLHLAAKYADWGVIRILLSYGASRTAVNKAGQTPAQVASEWGNDEIVRLL